MSSCGNDCFPRTTAHYRPDPDDVALLTWCRDFIRLTLQLHEETCRCFCSLLLRILSSLSHQLAKHLVGRLFHTCKLVSVNAHCFSLLIIICVQRYYFFLILCLFSVKKSLALALHPGLDGLAGYAAVICEDCSGSFFSERYNLYLRLKYGTKMAFSE